MTIRTTLLTSAACLLPIASPGQAQQTPTAPAAQPSTNAGAAQGAEDIPEEPDIVVVGQRPRGSVIGDIPPENTLDARDIRATGATNINVEETGRQNVKVAEPSSEAAVLKSMSSTLSRTLRAMRSGSKATRTPKVRASCS